MNPPSSSFPQILAPAGNKASFLAALAAGADAIYCGLKQLSARMEAKNFTLEELAGLTDLAHSKGTRVYVTLNTLIKPEELDPAGRLMDDLNRHVHPDALIIQDLGLIELAQQTGFSGEIHLSTLANVSFGQALNLIRRIPGVSRIVLPRELSVDEIKQIADTCPENIGLEIFVHGALCYGVSGRCYWSSFLGGKSGLRGRCVQPCRRHYTQEREQNRFFSCQDLSLDILVKVLRPVPAIRAWKIEGRKKSPHYVYYTIRAYQLLRDHVQDAHLRKEALALLSRALGRTGTHYGFLSQRPLNPIQIEQQTGSGLCVGHVSGESSRPHVALQQALFPGDVLRVGYEDEPWHVSLRISRPVSESTRFPLASGGKAVPQNGSPVFLTDRREPELIARLLEFEAQIPPVAADLPPSQFQAILPRKRLTKTISVDQRVYRTAREIGKTREEVGIWLSRETFQTASATPNICQRIWWWLTPALWPVDEADFKSMIDQLLQKGSKQFVLNAPWQIAFFQNTRKLSLWAGPFCNLSNPLSINEIKSYGFSGAIVSPELGQSDYLSLPGQSPLPLGIVLSGNWPLSISRILSDRLKPDTLFQSPKGEMAWASLSDSNYWVYPNWMLNLTDHRKELVQAGFQRFVHLMEPVPPSIRMKDRPGNWNWRISLP
ncbi:MAG: U32 family peptidase [Deltaproteobacteria bacterium]|nr:U32 family peptidase [Deltaproteobacteria bacterium]